MSGITITIHQCPKCNGSHEYTLDVTSSLYEVSKEGRKSIPGPVRKFFRRNFICQTKHKPFSAGFCLVEKVGENIEDAQPRL
ncbi:MAG: hypothetical protein B6I38_06890 [Anaerolineaceae bacterium 4572_5.1]|nr:MAG: hypothetical protein B6I38_06890 [Anaerolineaceae bacterium 4572_5.1]